jgi:hypothetical protein
MRPRLSHLLPALTWLVLAASSAQGQTPPPARPAARPQPARPAEPPANCLVTEFRALALNTHDLKERAAKASDWLRRHGATCTEDQLRILYANRSNWLGNADSMQLTSQIEGALESRLKNKPEQLAQLFGAPARPPATNETIRSGDLAPRPAPVVAPGTPAVVQAAPVVAVPVAAATAGANSPPTARPAPAAGKPPEPGKFFDPALRKAVQDYFTANRGSTACPADLILKNNRCESPNATRSWKIGQPLPVNLSAKALPAPLLEALGAPPKGHSYVQVAGDLLLVADDSKTVVDSVLDLGQITPRS